MTSQDHFVMRRLWNTMSDFVTVVWKGKTYSLAAHHWLFLVVAGVILSVVALIITAASAFQFHDEPMKQALEEGRKAAYDLNTWRDSRNNTLKVTNAQRRKDEEKRAAQEPYLRGPTDPAGTPATEHKPVPELEQQKPMLPGSQEELPADDGRPGIDLPKGGTSPRSEGAPQQQQPRQQVAGADNFVPGEQMAAADEGQFQSPVPERRIAQQWQPEQNILDSPNNPFKYSGGLEPFAQRMWRDGRLGVGEKVTPEMLSWIEARRNQIDRQLDDIARSNLNGDDVTAAVKQVVPQFGDALEMYVDGRAKIPENKQRKQRILQLGNKVDPSFNEQTYGTRFAAVKSIAGGPDGRTIVSISTSFQHADTLKQAAQAIEDKGGNLGRLFGMRLPRILNKGYQAFQREMGDFTFYPEGADAVEAFKYAVRQIAPEFARAQKGAAPTLQEIKDVENIMLSFDSKEPLFAYIDMSEHLFVQRMGEMHRKFGALMGKDPRGGVEQLFQDFEKSHSFGKWDEKDASPMVLPVGGSYTDGLKRLNQKPVPYPNWEGLPPGWILTPGDVDAVIKRSGSRPQEKPPVQRDPRFKYIPPPTPGLSTQGVP
jgi:hypothetical protein